MNIFGGFVLVMGFFGKNYENLYHESASALGYNRAAYTSLADQKSSGIVGFSLLLVGFVEQAIPYLPYNTSLSSAQVGFILVGINIVCSVFLLAFRRYMTRFYVGLLLINWLYNQQPIPNEYVQEVIRVHSLEPGIERTKFLERKAKRSVKLYLNIACLGKVNE